MELMNNISHSNIITKECLTNHLKDKYNKEGRLVSLQYFNQLSEQIPSKLFDDVFFDNLDILNIPKMKYLDVECYVYVEDFVLVNKQRAVLDYGFFNIGGDL